MRYRIFVALTVLLLCLSAAACSFSIKDSISETASAVATDTHSANNPLITAEPTMTSDIQPPAITIEPSPSSVTSQPLLDTPQPSHEITPQSPEPADADFVRVLDYIPTAFIDLKYATTDNFTGRIIYDFADAYIRYGTVIKLMAVQEKLSEQGLSLKIWDAFRPVAAQFTLWEAYPDPNFVANPNKGHSSHSKGNTVDVTLICLDGTEVKMPTGFDDFSNMTDRDYSDVDAEAAANALILENIMLDSGFTAYVKEWWHFSDTTSYPVEEAFAPQ